MCVAETNAQAANARAGQDGLRQLPSVIPPHLQRQPAGLLMHMHASLQPQTDFSQATNVPEVHGENCANAGMPKSAHAWPMQRPDKPGNDAPLCLVESRTCKHHL